MKDRKLFIAQSVSRMRRIVLVAFWMQVALLVWGASFGGSMQAGVIRMFGVDDKMLHFLAFAVVGLTALWLWRSACLVIAVLFALAGLLEAAQQFLPGREASLIDLGASAAGLLMAWALSWALVHRERGAGPSVGS